MVRQSLNNKRMTFWIDKALKEEGDEIIYLLGLKPSIVINLLYRQIVTHKEIPFYIKMKDDNP